MIKQLTLSGATKDRYPIQVHFVQNAEGYAVFVEVKTENRVYSDMVSGYYTDYKAVSTMMTRKDALFWWRILEECMKSVCYYYILALYRMQDKPLDDFYRERDAEVEANMRAFPVKFFEADCRSAV